MNHGIFFFNFCFAFCLVLIVIDHFDLLLAVTTVDSGSKALKFLGLHEDDTTNPNTPSLSPNNHQVGDFYFNI